MRSRRSRTIRRCSADRDELDRIFGRLPLERRAVFVLHHLVGLSLVEVAETLAIPAGTARSRLHYATRALRFAMLVPAHQVEKVGSA
jgi:RNA polymerase sigma-70 factor (ECF subfamily)